MENDEYGYMKIEFEDNNENKSNFEDAIHMISELFYDTELPDGRIKECIDDIHRKSDELNERKLSK